MRNKLDDFVVCGSLVGFDPPLNNQLQATAGEGRGARRPGHQGSARPRRRQDVRARNRRAETADAVMEASAARVEEAGKNGPRT